MKPKNYEPIHEEFPIQNKTVVANEINAQRTNADTDHGKVWCGGKGPCLYKDYILISQYQRAGIFDVFA